MANPAIVALNEVGQSVWYDNLSRDVLRSGELKRLIDSGVSGLTSNPTIFKKAIADTSDYDDDIRALAAKGLDDEGICEELMVQDVAAAADLLRPIYDQSQGADGCASIEVSPLLARNHSATVEAAKRIWSKLKRPNIMIKIPGTKECLPSVREVLTAGINVNITLLFSVENYQQVVEQYISALEARAKKGEPIDRISSVASFFVSRVDAICEGTFDKLVKSGKAQASGLDNFFGKVGIANALVTYECFKQLFAGPRFKTLSESNRARVQRPLWASTGTKNPKLNPLLYVEELAGPHTVNTMPPATLDKLLQGAKISNRLDVDTTPAKSVLNGLAQLGLDFPGLMVELQTQGVALFEGSYNELVTAIKEKRTKLGAAKA